MPDESPDGPDTPAAQVLGYAGPTMDRKPSLDVWAIVARVAAALVVLVILVGGYRTQGLVLITALATLLAAAVALMRTTTIRGVRLIRVQRKKTGARSALLCLIVGLAGLAAVPRLSPALGRSREVSQRIKCASNLRYLGQVIHDYANAFDGAMPSSLDALAEAMPLDRERLICPNDRARGPMTGSIVIGANCSYLVFLDRGALGDPGMMIGSCVPHLHEGDGANVLFGDGSIRWEQDRVFTSMLVGDPELER